MWFSETDGLYAGNCKPGDRAATQEEIAAWLSANVTDDLVRWECQRRIDAVVSNNQKLNMLGAMVAKQITGDHTDDTPFLRSMQWIEAMRDAIEALIGNVDYQADNNWPVLDADLIAFAARF